MKFSFVGTIDESLREGTMVELICAALSVLTLSLSEPHFMRWCYTFVYLCLLQMCDILHVSQRL